MRLAVAVEAALDLVPRGRHPDGEALAEQARRSDRLCGPAGRRGDRDRGCAGTGASGGVAVGIRSAWQARRMAVRGLDAAAPRGGWGGAVRAGRRTHAGQGASTRCRPRRGRGGPGSGPAARSRRSRLARRPPARRGPHRSPRPPGDARRPGSSRWEAALQPEQAVELVGDALQRAAHRGELGHRASRDSAWATAISASSTATRSRRRTRGRRAAAQVLGGRPSGVALPTGGHERQGGQDAADGHVPVQQAPVPPHVAAPDQEGRRQARTTTRPAMTRNSSTWAAKVTTTMLRRTHPDCLPHPRAPLPPLILYPRLTPTPADPGPRVR